MRRRNYLYGIVLVAILALGVALGYMFLGRANTGPGPVDIEVLADKPFYMQGEEVRFSIQVNNQQNWQVEYPSELSYAITQDGHFVDGFKLFVDPPPGAVSTFPAHSTKLYDTYVWDQKTGTGDNQTLVQPGNYMFSVSFRGSVNYGDSGNCTIEIRPNPSPLP